MHDARQGETVSLNAAKNTLDFYVVLAEPGDRRLIDFKIANTGSLPARLQELSEGHPPESTGVRVNWPYLENLRLLPGDSSETFTIVVEWDENAANVATGAVSFNAEIHYTQD